MNSFEDIWATALGMIKEDITQVIFNLYISSLVFDKYENDTFFVITDKEYKKQIIEEKYLDKIKACFEQVLGFPVNVEIEIKKTEDDDDADGNLEEDTKRQLTARYTFESFITGNENQFAYNIALGAANNPGTRYNPVMIYGASGLGKTHLMFAAYNRMIKNNPDYRIIVTSGESFMNELFESIGNETSADFHKKYRNCDALFIDDIQFIARGGKSVQEEIFYCFDKLFTEGKQIFMVSDRPPREMTILEDRLRSRFTSGVIQDILPPDKDTRIAIINKKAEQLNFEIPPKTVEMIADKIKTNVRQLEGIVNKIEAVRTISGSLPSMEQVRQMINEIITDNQPVSVTVDKILERVSSDTEVNIEDIKSKKRDKKIKDARQVCIYIIRQKTNLTLNEIGEIFSISHSTVIHSIEQIEKEKEENPSLKIVLDNIVNDF